jgi:hypothetical protein
LIGIGLTFGTNAERRPVEGGVAAGLMEKVGGDPGPDRDRMVGETPISEAMEFPGRQARLRRADQNSTHTA